MISVIEYDSQKGVSTSKDYKGGSIYESNDKSLVWLDFKNPTEDEIKILHEKFKFHPLAIKDCVNRHHRSKIDEYDKYVFLVLHTIEINKKTMKLEVRELAIFFGMGFLVTFHWEEIEAIEEIKRFCPKNQIIMEKGADFLLYQILDTIVEDYFPLLDKLDERFAAIEAKIFDKPDVDNFNKLFNVKRELLHMRKILGPQREMYSALVRHEFPYIQEENRMYYVDINDHLLRVFDFLDTYRDLISNASEAQLSVISNRMNEIMKTLTVIATIMLPLTVITGIYGMNFKWIPELQFKYGYFFILGLMAFISLGMIYYFRKKNWF